MMKLLVAALALVALAQAQDSSEEKMMSGVKNMMEMQEDRMEEFKMFVKIMEFMKKGKEEDSKDFHDMFKMFAKMVWKMKGGESEEKEESSMEKMEKMMMGGESEEEEEGKDEKMKKLFVLFMKFKDHYKKQKEMEDKKEAAERKFAMFQELCSFAKKAHAKKEILEKMGEMVEKKMKMKFMAFKMCMLKGKCEKEEDSSEEKESDNKHKELFEKMKEMMEKVSKKMMEKMKSKKEGSEEEMGGMSKMMKSMMGDEEEEEESAEDKDKKEEVMKAMLKHLMEKAEKGFWDQDKDEAEKKMKKMFMAAKAMKMMKEMHEKMEKMKMAKMMGGMGSEEQEESSEEKEEGDKLAMFSEFMSKMEKAKKMKEEFGDFMQWKKEKMMDEKKDAEKEMPTFTYFDVRARGEISRLIIEYGDLPIKQIRVNQSEWAALKPTMPFGQLPVLNISGMAFAQSLAIQKFLAIKAGLYPKSPKEQLLTDMIANAREDLLIQEIRVAQEQNVTQQAILRAGLPAAYDLYFSNFKQYLEANPAGRNGLVLGDKLSLADLIIFEGSQTAFQTMPEILDKFPAIKALRAKVMATEGLMHYLVKRPKFDL